MGVKGVSLALWTCHSLPSFPASSWAAFLNPLSPLPLLPPRIPAFLLSWLHPKETMGPGRTEMAWVGKIKFTSSLEIQLIYRVACQDPWGKCQLICCPRQIRRVRGPTGGSRPHLGLSTSPLALASTLQLLSCQAPFGTQGGKLRQVCNGLHLQRRR